MISEALRPGPAPCMTGRGFRHLDCGSYLRCGDVAAEHAWLGWTCAGCRQAEGQRLLDIAVQVDVLPLSVPQLAALAGLEDVIGDNPVGEAPIELMPVPADRVTVLWCPDCGDSWEDGQPCACHGEEHPDRPARGWNAHQAWRAWLADLVRAGWTAGHALLNPRGCQEPGCPQARRARGMCSYHYGLWRVRQGQPDCQAPDCPKTAWAGGLCRAHYTRRWRARRNGGSDG